MRKGKIFLTKVAGDFLFFLLIFCTLAFCGRLSAQTVVIIKPDQGLSGRLQSTLPNAHVQFGHQEWQDFRTHDFFLGTFVPTKYETVLLYAFRVEQPLLDAIDRGHKPTFVFTICEDHTGQGKNIFPLEISLLNKNSHNAMEAAKSQGEVFSTIKAEDFLIDHAYRQEIPQTESWEEGDVIWLGIDFTGHEYESGGSVILGGDRVSFPGSMPPMLICGPKQIISEQVSGYSLLETFHHQMRTPSRPDEKNLESRVLPSWQNPLHFEKQISLLETFRSVLMSELKTTPKSYYHQPILRRGYHSSLKAHGEGWVLKIPVNDNVTSIAFVPVVDCANYMPQPYGFPRRFRIIGSHDENEESLLVDWSQEDFSLKTQKPIIFSFPFRRYHDLRIEVLKGVALQDKHFFALDEIIPYAQGKVRRHQTVIAPEDSLQENAIWSPEFICDGISNMGTPLWPERVENTDLDLELLDKHRGYVEIQLALRGEVLMHSLELYPQVNTLTQLLPSPFFPERYRIELSSLEGYKVSEYVINHDCVDPVMDAMPLVHSFKGIKASQLRIMLWSRPEDENKSRIQLAEMTCNGGQRLPVDSFIIQNSKSQDINGLFDKSISGYPMGDLLPWMIACVRRELLEKEVVNVENELSQIKKAQSQFRFLVLALVLFILFSLLAMWVWVQRRRHQKEKNKIRRQFRRDLHDEIGSAIGTISLISENMLHAEKESGGRGELSDIHLCAQEASASLREVISFSEQPSTELSQCFKLLEQRISKMLPGTDLQINMPAGSTSTRVGDTFRRHLFSLVTECLHNIQKHAQAQKVEVKFVLENHQLKGSIQDDGKGFQLGVKSYGMGLRNINERASILGGKLDIESELGQGTSISFQLPIKE
ncbi:MAG: hypothetical protein HQL32_02240 [Planctomycetes bacterium]|nr:hypothetical protein [Planctomycetota bacterium]